MNKTSRMFVFFILTVKTVKRVQKSVATHESVKLGTIRAERIEAL